MFNLAGYLIFALVTSVTPGPNNYMLLNHGKQYGLKETYSLMAGIFAGFFALLCVAGYGIAAIILQFSAAGIILKAAGSLWLLYIGIQMLGIRTGQEKGNGKKFGFFDGFLMQFVNPKAWIMAAGGAGSFMPELGSIHLNVFVLASTFSIIGIPCMLLWVYAGEFISRIIKSDRANKISGFVLFLLMLFSIVTIWI